MYVIEGRGRGSELGSEAWFVVARVLAWRERHHGSNESDTSFLNSYSYSSPPRPLTPRTPSVYFVRLLHPVSSYGTSRSLPAP